MKKAICVMAFHLAGLIPVLGQTINTNSQDQKMLPKAGGGANASIGNIYSPSLFDGSANVSIPIYKYQNDFGDFGIALSYNTKGVPVDELSGPVGMHWNVNYGGAVYRTVRDLPDELDMAATASTGPMRLVGKTKQYTLASKASNEYWDGMNDDYTVSAGNLNFSFKLGKNGYIFTYPDSRAKIVKSPSTNSLYPQEFDFTITDVDGVRYDFNVSDMRDQSFQTGNFSSNGYYALVPFTYVSKWKLTKITFPNGQVIKYNYQEATYPPDFFLYKSFAEKEGLNTSNAAYATNIPAATVTGSTTSGLSYNIDSINYPNNVTAAFEYDQTATVGTGCEKTIKDIKITEGDQCSKYFFRKKYLTQLPNTTQPTEVDFDNSCTFDNAAYGSAAYRLLLKGVDIGNCANSTVEPYYSFEYSNAVPVGRLSKAKDFFGYCNGAGSAMDIPTWPAHQHPFSTTLNTYGDNRNVSTDINLIGTLSLTKVKNAYGGTVTFKYEPHVLTNVLTGLPTTDPLFLGLNAADGQRLKSVTTEDKYYPGNSKVTSYTYSGGQFFLNGGYFSYPSSLNTSGAVNEYIMTSNWVSPHQLINGSNHGYSNVTVETRDNASNLLSKTVYAFSNFKDGSNLRMLLYGPAGTKNYYQAPYTDKQYIKDWEIGLPTLVTQYDQNGYIISRTTNHYTSQMKDNAVINAGLQTNVNTLSKPLPNYVSGLANVNIFTNPIIARDTFIPYSGKALLDTSITETFYDDTRTVSDTVFYHYDSRWNQDRVITRNSKGEYFLSKNIFNYTVMEANPAGSLPASNALKLLYDNGIEKKVAAERWKMGTAGTTSESGNKLYDATIFVYSKDADKIWMQKLFSLRSLSPIDYTTYAGSGTNTYSKVVNAYSGTIPTGFQLTTELLKKDIINNPTETQIGATDLYKSMIWDVTTGNKLAEANCRLNEMAFSSFECSTTGNWIYNTSFVANPSASGLGNIDGSRALKVYLGDASPLSVSGLTPGKEYVFTFWSTGTIATLAGGGLSNIPLTQLTEAVDPTGTGWKFFQARFTPLNNSPVGITQPPYPGHPPSFFIDDARVFPSGTDMNCWTYKPLHGPASAISPAGRITYFEYDAFGRQVIVKNQEGKVLSKKEYNIGQ